MQYREKCKKLLDKSVDAHKPWSMIQMVGGISVPATVDADKRIGAMVFKLHDDVPKDLVVHVSEQFTTVNRTNATWSFIRPSGFTIFPQDQKYRKPNVSEAESRRKFSQIHLLFMSRADDARFGVQITFPQEEAAVLRR